MVTSSPTASPGTVSQKGEAGNYAGSLWFLAWKKRNQRPLRFVFSARGSDMSRPTAGDMAAPPSPTFPRGKGEPGAGDAGEGAPLSSPAPAEMRGEGLRPPRNFTVFCAHIRAQETRDSQRSSLCNRACDDDKDPVFRVCFW